MKAHFIALVLMGLKWPVAFLSEQIGGRNSAGLQCSRGLSRRLPALTHARWWMQAPKGLCCWSLCCWVTSVLGINAGLGNCCVPPSSQHLNGELSQSFYLFRANPELLSHRVTSPASYGITCSGSLHMYSIPVEQHKTGCEASQRSTP